MRPSFSRFELIIALLWCFSIKLRSDARERGGGISNSLWLLIKESVTFIKPSRSVTANMPSYKKNPS
jgi:hypothetical protein